MPFDGPQRHVLTWTTTMSAEDVVGLAASYSAVLTMTPEKRRAELELVRARSAELCGTATIEIPMNCRIWRAVRR